MKTAKRDPNAKRPTNKTRAPAGLLVFLLLLGMIFSTAPANGTAASIDRNSPPDGFSTQATTIPFTFTYHKNDDIYPQPHCALLLNGTITGSGRFTDGVQGEIDVSGLDRAPYEWAISCEDTVTDTRTFTVLPLDPPSLSLDGPADQTNITGPTVTFTYDYNSGSDELNQTNCSLIAGPFVEGTGIAISGQTNAIVSDELRPALYPWYVSCLRTGNNKPLTTKPWLITVVAPPEPVVPNLTNATPPAPAADNNTFVNQQVEIDAAPAGTIGVPIVVVLHTLDGQPVSGAQIDVYTAEGTKVKLSPTDQYGQAGYTPSTVGDYTYSVENLLLVKPSTTTISRPVSAADENAAAGTGPGQSGGSGNPSGAPGGGSKTASKSNIRPPTDADNSAMPGWEILSGGAVLLVLAIAIAFKAMSKPPAKPGPGAVMPTKVKPATKPLVINTPSKDEPPIPEDQMV